MGNNAQQLNKDKVERCSFDKIDLKIGQDDKEKTIKLLDSTVSRYVFMVSHYNGKEIAVDAVRKNANKCLMGNAHSQFHFDDKPTNAKTIKIPYKKIPEETSDFSFLSYFFLPIDKRENHLLKFNSCSESVFCPIISYSDIQYNIALGWDINKKKISFKFTAKYNDGFKKEFTISSEDVNMNADLKKKTEAARKVIQALEILLEGGKVVEKMSKIKSPIKVDPMTPNLSLSLTWNYVASKDYFNLGRQICISFSAKPLAGLSLTIDLLQIGLNALAPGLGTLVSLIQDLMKECGTGVEVVCNIVIEGRIDATYPEVTINTAEEKSVTLNSGKMEGKVGVSLNAKVAGRAKIWTFEASAEAAAKGSASMTLEGKLTYVKEILALALSVNFDGLKVSAMWKIEAGLSKKKMGYGQEKELILMDKKTNLFNWQPLELINFNKS